MKTFAIILTICALAYSAPAQKITRITVSATIGRTARFERKFQQKQFNVGLLASYKFTRRLSFNFGLTQAFETDYPSYSTRIVWRIF